MKLSKEEVAELGRLEKKYSGRVTVKQLEREARRLMSGGYMVDIDHSRALLDALDEARRERDAYAKRWRDGLRTADAEISRYLGMLQAAHERLQALGETVMP